MIPATAVFTDVNNVTVTSDSALVLGLFEEPPKDWGTVSTPPDSTSPDYNALNPDEVQLNTVTTRDQTSPIVATDGISTSHNVVVVWQDHRSSTANPDIYLRWSSSEEDVGSEHPRQYWGDASSSDPLISHEAPVNSDAGGTAAHQNPAVAVAPNGDVVVAWQDNRYRADKQPGDEWDVYLQQYRFSGGVLSPIGGNVRVQTGVCPAASETRPDIAVDKVDNSFYVVWQSMCTQQSALWATKGKSPGASESIVWQPGRYVVDPSSKERRDPRIDAALAPVISVTSVEFPPNYPIDPAIVNYTLGYTTYVAVTWHEDRGLPTGDDVYATYNDDQLRGPFGVDLRVNQDASTLSYNRIQDQPAVAVTQSREDLTIYAQYENQCESVEIKGAPVPALHIVWRDFRNSTGSSSDPNFPGNKPDIYYAYAPIKLSSNEDQCGFYFHKLVIEDNRQVNNHDTGAWQTVPPKHLNPDIVGWSCSDATLDRPYHLGIVWADSRNYNDRNYDTYLALDPRSRCQSEHELQPQ